MWLRLRVRRRTSFWPTLWLPLFVVWLLLLPLVLPLFALGLSVVAIVAPSSLRAACALGAALVSLICALRGTQVDVVAPGSELFIRID